MTAERYDLDRREMLSFLPSDAATMLDVGCATGRFGALTRAQIPAVELWGIDPEMGTGPDLEAYNHLVHGRFPEDLAGRRFDCVVFNDVLEHIVDPWGLLAEWPQWLSDDGVVIASIPNIRHLTILYRLAIRGDWTYEDTGLLDRTHVRFFTRRTIIALFEQAGLQIVRIAPINLPRRGPLGRLRRLSGNRLTDLLALQYAVVARPSGVDRRTAPGD